MVEIPPGSAVVGSTEAETLAEGVPSNYALREQPRHLVSIARPLALGRHEVTRGQFRHFLRATGHRPAAGCAVWQVPEWKFADDPQSGWSSPGFRQTDDHPVVCVSFDDAIVYVRWLSRSTGLAYRLPTEAEWEYAARAGSTTFRFWGDDAQAACASANSFDLDAASGLGRLAATGDYVRCRDGFIYTAPVGSFQPNAFGLFDMLGNASEWVQDCATDSYLGAPTDGSAVLTDGCALRVTRGGSWSGKPWLLRSAERGRAMASGRNSPLGFRVARDLAAPIREK